MAVVGNFSQLDQTQFAEAPLEQLYQNGEYDNRKIVNLPQIHRFGKSEFAGSRAFFRGVELVLVDLELSQTSL
jgi:hypothetical protein